MQPSEAAVVTGASSGIGEACARHLLDQGISVVALQRSPPRLKHANLHFRPIDLADLAATRTLAQQIAREFPVRYLVNNAGANRPALLEEATIDDFEYVTAITLGAAMVLTQALVPAMRAANFGRIVNISSRAIMGKTSRTVYASAKAGLIGMTRTIACEVGGDGVTVNTVIPGPVASDLFNRGHPEGSVKRQTVIDGILVKRVGTPDDIARAVLFFLARDAGYVTGQALFVCGGTSVTGTGGA
ncbi:MAG: short-chain dehydrogenase/reductase [Betaproteobacteria bacterium]|nr:short-chain dehydrogenase/reductase [Betaproteobacteria bacterium]